MKKLLGFIMLAFMFVACGSDTPDVVVKKCMQAYIKEDVKQVAKCAYYKTEDEKQRYLKDIIYSIKRDKEFINTKSGVKLIETSIVNENENVAQVKVVVMYNNGDKDNGLIDLVKINGSWYVKK